MIASEFVRGGWRAAAAALPLMHALAEAAPAGEEWVASWAIEVSGDATQRTLRILRVEAGAEPATGRVEAQIGFRGQRLVPLAMDLVAGQVPTLRFTTPLGAKADLRQVDAGRFEGEWTLPDGQVRAARLLRMAPGEDTSPGPPLHIIKPAADVPADCAALSGLWEGQWSFLGWGSVWVWVLEVDARCQAKVALQSKLSRPRAYKVIDVSGGSGVLPYGQGTYAMKLAGDELRLASTWYFSSYSNGAVLKRVADPLH